MTSRRYDAVLFDLLTALLDSWSLWNAVAGGPEAGRRWRAEYLRITYCTGGYRPYEDLVAEAAASVGLPPASATELEERYGELRPWPGVTQVLQALAARSVPLGVVTNCSERLGRIAAGCVGVEFGAVVTAERAGFYKPDPRPYQLGLEELGVDASRCLFVAGSSYDLVGTAKVGLATYWHDRVGMPAPESAPVPLAHEPTLDLLPAFVEGADGPASPWQKTREH
ncbi:HAD-IA family hydrolase [Methylobacterium planeticum]|nr:HAD-IA family hydrolase [Methylobacterium planeticum]